MKKISILGILVGGITDIVLTNVVALPIIIYVVATSNLRGIPREQLSAAIIQAIHARPAIYATQLILGFFCTVFGGYVAAWIAKRSEVLNGFLASLACALFGVYGMVSGKDMSTPATRATLFLLTFAAGLCGGYLRKIRVRRIALASPGAA